MTKILLTGADGFIGKEIVKKLEDMKIKLITYTKKDGDILDYDFHSIEPEYVIHTAGITFIPDSWDNPYEFFRVNTLGTCKILELCKDKNVPLLFISSYLYGNPEYLPIDEIHPNSAPNPYAFSKLMAEQYVKFYEEKFGLQCTIIRPFNIYGPGQSEKFLIPTLINQVLDKSKENIIVNDLRPKRDYLFVEDLVDAIMVLMNSKSTGIFNIGSGISYSIPELLNYLYKLLGFEKPIQSNNKPRVEEIFDIRANINKISKLNWQPKVDIQNGLKKCVKNLMG